MNELRRSLSRSKDADRLRRKAARVKKDAYLFRKREKGLDDSEHLILDGWLRSIPELGEAWRLKEVFTVSTMLTTKGRPPTIHRLGGIRSIRVPACFSTHSHGLEKLGGQLAAQQAYAHCSH